MRSNREFTISTKNLVAAMNVAGYNKLAYQIADEYDLLLNIEGYLDAFIWPKKTIKKAGFWDRKQERNLTFELDQVVQVMVQSKKKFRCEDGERVLKIYYIDDQHKIIEIMESDHHTFFDYHSEDNFYDLLLHFYHVTPNRKEDITKKTIRMSKKLHKSLEWMGSSSFHKMIHDDQYSSDMKDFIRNFRDNSQKLNFISFVHTDYGMDDEIKINMNHYSVPGEGFVWKWDHSDDEEPFPDEFNISTVLTSVYFQKLNEDIKSFFAQPELDKQNDKRAKELKMRRGKFKTKSGVRFFYKSNFVLAAPVILFYINLNQWVGDKPEKMILFIFAAECFIFLFSFLACFKPKF